MATPKEIFSTDFASESSASGLEWTRNPAKVEYGVEDGKGMRVSMAEKSDYWQKTYYDPPLIVDHGHLLYRSMDREKFAFETEFTIMPEKQFDQAGLMVRLDTDHWIKTGIEVVDKKCKLSCVTTNVYSDWSTQEWPTNKLAIRVYKLGNDFVIEAKSPDADKWDFFRICHLNVGKTQELKVGVFACAPLEAGGHVVFHHLKYTETEGYDHKAT